MEEGVPGPKDTLAEGFSQMVTPNSILALRAIPASGGTAAAVSNGEMLAMIPFLARTAAIYAAPAAALASLKKIV